MKKLIFMGVLGLFILGSCNNKAGHNHEGHNHGTEAHDHEHEGHDHEQEIHNTKEECQDHDHGKEASSGPVSYTHLRAHETHAPDIATKSSCPKQKRMQPV